MDYRFKKTFLHSDSYSSEYVNSNVTELTKKLIPVTNKNMQTINNAAQKQTEKFTFD